MAKEIYINMAIEKEKQINDLMEQIAALKKEQTAMLKKKQIASIHEEINTLKKITPPKLAYAKKN